MRIVRFLDDENRRCYGCKMKNGYADLLEGDVFSGFKETIVKVKIKKLLVPVEPAAIFCIGLNYKEHAKELNLKPPENPVLFMKNPASIIGSHEPIIIPASCADPFQIDYEIELAVIIGKTAKNVPKEKALDYILGYTVANDVSARTWQIKNSGGQWSRGKSFDTFCPMGPVFAPSSDISDPDKLALRCTLNGEIMQESNTSDMIFSISELIEFLSKDTTLVPGTIILTGTPGGVGFTRNPPVFLKPGDRLEMSIEKIGTLVNTVVL
jgi:2-keto-4-pentenoate hydratase/2-oxohepta-3-ene-1,7-dioic acid hydratase in catechol pathway